MDMFENEGRPTTQSNLSTTVALGTEIRGHCRLGEVHDMTPIVFLGMQHFYFYKIHIVPCKYQMKAFMQKGRISVMGRFSFFAGLS